MSAKLQQYLEHIFASEENFEKLVFEIESDADRAEIVRLIAKQIVTESEMRNKVNFNYLPTLNNMDLSDFAHAVTRLLIDEAIEWLSQIHPDEEAIRGMIQNDKMKLFFLHEIAMSYFFEYEELFYGEIAESFFEMVRQAGSFRQIPKIGHDAISGTSKVRSLFLLDDGAQIVRRADQVWMRVDQASKAKKRKVFSLTNDLKKYKEQVEDLQIRIVAIDQAAKLDEKKLRTYTPEKIREIFTEEKPELLMDRRLLAMVPAGELAALMETTCERAAINSKTMMAREEFKKIQALFSKAKINNTPRELQMKRMEFEHKLPFKKERYMEVVERYQDIKDEPLENFDEQLAKIKQVMVHNLKKFPVNK